MASFDWQDPFRLNDQLTDEEKLIANSSREFCSDRLSPRIIEANRNESFDRTILTKWVKWDFWDQQ